MAGGETNTPHKAFGITNIKTYVPLILDLDRLNYDAWRELFSTHCIGFDVLDHIDDTTPKPTDPEWKKIDSIVKLWIYGSISQSLLQMVLKKDSTDNRVMSALGKTGVIVNVARGAIIDEAELVKCLVDGKIGGAGLDVFENEPNVPKELIGLDNVVLLPHRTALTKESFHDAAQILLENLEAFFTNKNLFTLVANEF